MSTTVAPLGLRLFLEGIEVPVISAQVTITPDQPAVATVQVVPSDMALHLLPRTLVHLFYLDDDQLPERPPPAGGAPNNDLNRFEAPDAQYKLLFAGEVIGFNYGKASDSRQLVLQCMDLSSYWDTCYQWYADYSVGGGALTDKMHVFMGAGKSEFNSVSGGHQWVIGELITHPPKSPEYQNLKGLLGGIVHLLEAIGGLRYTKGGDPGVNGVNDFFTIAELRYNLLGMIGAVEKDDTSAKLYSAKAFISWLRNGMTSMGNLLSFRDVINHVNQYIYHHIYPNPCAYFREGALGSRNVQVTATQFTDTPEGKLVQLYVRGAVNALKKAWKNVSPPTILSVPVTYEQTAQAFSMLEQAESGMDAVQSDDSATVKAKITQAKSTVQQALATFKNMGFDPATEKQMPGFYEETRPYVTEDYMETDAYKNQAASASQLDGYYNTALQTIDEETGILSLRERTTTLRAVPTQTIDKAHLYSQLIFPETFFVSPPRCNVLFPDQYYQFSFSRNFMREVTRLSCTAGLGFLAGGGQGGATAALLSHAYYAPNIQDARKTSMYLTMSRASTVLLPHEIHSGIIPKFEWVSDGHRWAAKAAKDTGVEDDFYKSGKVGFLQRLANFQFFLHRWESRSMSVTGIFNPNLVLGLPGVVMDRSMPAPEVVKRIETKLGRRWLPIQYLGKVAYISHSIHQQGGMTQVSFTHCRMHRGFDDEFLGVLVRDVQQTANKKVTIKFRTAGLFGTFASESTAGVQVTGGGTKFSSQSLDDLRDLLGLYLEKKLNPMQTVPSPKSFRGAKVLKVIPMGASTVSDDDLKNVGIVGGGTGSNTIPESLEIQFELKVSTGKYDRSTVSIEECLTPSWYSDVWTNAKIGEEVYRPLLGIGAITDWVGLKASQQTKLLDQTLLQEATVTNEELNAAGPEPSMNPFSIYEDPTGVTDTQFNANPGSIEEAVDSLTILYGLMKHRGADMHDFIKQYTKRPVADLEQVLGSSNLAYDATGAVDPTIQGRVVEGFHSRAFGDYNADVKYGIREGEKPQAGKDALVGLFPPGVPAATVLRSNMVNKDPKAKSAIPPYYDPRGRARARVRAYVEELEVSRGLVG